MADNKVQQILNSLIMRKVVGSPILEGPLSYFVDTVGNISYSPVSVDNCGNMNVPGTLTVNNGIVLGGMCPSVSAPTSMSLQPTGGNVGIGLCNPLSTLDVCGTAHVTGAVVCDSTLNVGGAVVCDSTLDVGGAVVCDSTLDVGGAAHVGDSVICDSYLEVGGAAYVIGAVVCDSTLYTQGAVSFDSSLDVCGTVHVADAVTVDSVSNLDGGISVQNNLTVDTDGNLTIANGNLTVNGDGNNTGSVQGAYVTFPDLNLNGLESYLWNQSDTLYWQDNIGKIQPISGWWPILNPAGSTLNLLDPSSATTSQIATTLNALMTRISTQGAFFITKPPVSPSITFQTSLSMKFGYSSSATGPFTVFTVTQSAGTTTSLSSLQNYVNNNIAVPGSPLSIVSLSNNKVAFQCLPNYYYKFIDVNFPGEASLFMNHFNIQIPSNYIGNSYSAINIPGGAIIDASFGIAPIPGGGSGLAASGVTTSSFDVSWSTSTNAVYYAVSNGTVGTIVVATNYTFSNLMQSVPYTITVVPLGQFDAGTSVGITKTITPITVAVETLGLPYWSATPATAGPYNNYYGPNTSFPTVATVSNAIWSGPGAFAALTNTKQINGIVLKYCADIGDNSFSDARCYTTTPYGQVIFYAEMRRITKPGSQYAIGSPWYDAYTPTPNPPPYAPTPAITNLPIINSILNGDSITGNITPGPINFGWYCGGNSGYPNTMNNMKVEQFQVSFVYLV
jgi:hypothetical protein